METAYASPEGDASSGPNRAAIGIPIRGAVERSRKLRPAKLRPGTRSFACSLTRPATRVESGSQLQLWRLTMSRSRPRVAWSLGAALFTLAAQGQAAEVNVYSARHYDT